MVKRTGVMAATVFLEYNGYEFTASEESMVENTLALAADKLNETGYSEWLKNNIRKRR